MNQGMYNVYYEIVYKNKIIESGYCLPEMEYALHKLHEFIIKEMIPSALLHIVHNVHKMRVVRYSNGVTAVLPNYKAYLRIKNQVRLVRTIK